MVCIVVRYVMSRVVDVVVVKADKLVWMEGEKRCYVPPSQTVSLSIMAGLLLLLSQVGFTVAGGCVCCNRNIHKFTGPAPLALKSLILSWYDYYHSLTHVTINVPVSSYIKTITFPLLKVYRSHSDIFQHNISNISVTSIPSELYLQHQFSILWAWVNSWVFKGVNIFAKYWGEDPHNNKEFWQECNRWVICWAVGRVIPSMICSSGDYNHSTARSLMVLLGWHS